MLEADSPNENGGIFALPVEYDSVLCSSKILPLILKKFGVWNINLENIAKFPLCTTYHNGIFMSANSMVFIFQIFIFKKK